MGVPQIENQAIVGFHWRPGCQDLLERLGSRFTLCLWSVSNRRYLDKILQHGLKRFFAETFSWDELPCSWKDIRKINADWLIDDSPHHSEAAREFGLDSKYVVVPAYGSPEDNADPLGWVRLIEETVLKT
ncbi:MAG: hypothetical protein L0Y72_08195 [Gemmataceae bacterium]|nr:hypothetical protein [Gemmataceae bacterium]MCI0739009.1 hypothetical protein [Gemmataceae bacterium]